MQKKRKTLVQIMVVRPDCVAADVKALYDSFKKKASKQKVGEAHHLVVFSGDLVAESSSKPWSDNAAPPQEALDRSKVFLDFMGGIKNKTDMVVAFDGQARPIQRLIQDALGKDSMECILMLSNLARFQVAAAYGNNKMMVVSFSHDTNAQAVKASWVTLGGPTRKSTKTPSARLSMVISPVGLCLRLWPVSLTGLVV